MPATGPQFQSVTVLPTLVPERGEAAIAVVSEFAAASDTPVLVRTEILQSELPVTTIEDPITVFRSDTSVVQSGVIPRVALWWPARCGRPSLYEARVSLLDGEDRLLDRRTSTFGVRQLEVEYRAGDAGEEPPLQVRVNGRLVLVRGAVWERLPAETLPDPYTRRLRLAAEAGINLLRVRGEELEAPVFYDLCDRYGILVWQDVPARVAASRAQAEREAGELITGLRSHPCLVLWCGGEPSAADLEALEALAEIAALEDPDRAWIGAAPLPNSGESDWSSWFGEGLTPGAAERARDLAEAVTLEQTAEAGLMRSGGPSVLLPCGFGRDGLLNPSGSPRLAYYMVKRAFGPFHVSAQCPTLTWAGESAFRAEVWLHNSGAERSLLNVVATVVDLQGRELYQENLAGEAPEGSAENVGDLHWRFPASFAEAFILFLEVIDEEGDAIARNAYYHSRAPEPALAPYLAAPETALAVERNDAGVVVRNVGAAVAVCVEIHGDEATVSDGGFPLPPGGSQEIAARGAGLTVAAWNAAPVAAPD